MSYAAKTSWTGDLFAHPGALVLARHRLAIDTDAAFEAMRTRTWRPMPVDASRIGWVASPAWHAAARRLHRGADVRVVRVARTFVPGCDVYVQIGDRWLHCYIPPEAP